MIIKLIFFGIGFYFFYRMFGHNIVLFLKSKYDSMRNENNKRSKNKKTLVKTIKEHSHRTNYNDVM